MPEKRFRVVFTDYDYLNIDIETNILKEIDCEIISLQSMDEDIICQARRDADAI